ncbi:MAG: ferredoxin [Patescibacteria group bacterium]
MVKIVVDPNLCIGCGACTMIEENVIKIDPKTGKAKAIAPVKNQKTAQEIIDICPVRAIKEEK